MSDRVGSDEWQSYRYRGDAFEAPVPLASSVGRVGGAGPHVRPSGTQAPWISLHDHVIRIPDPMTRENWTRYQAWGREHIGYPGLLHSGLTAVFHSMLSADDMGSVMRWATLLRADIAHHEGVVTAERVQDLDRAWADGQVALFLALEAATPIGEDLDNIEMLYGLGIRSMGLTYNRHNTLGDGLSEPEDRGLTGFGREAVRLMESLGMLVDLAHVGDQTALDALEISQKPMVISHAGARRLWPTRRMKPDAVIRECAARGGVIGIEAAPHTTLTLQHRRHNLEAFMAHFEYCVELVGIDHVAFGPDTMFGDHVGLHKLSPSNLEAPEHEWSEFVEGVENPGEAFWNIRGWLRSHGYSPEQEAQVMGGNVRRVMEEVLG